MSVKAETLEEWVGAEVVDREDKKLGKVEEVHYLGTEPLIIEIRSGLTGRKRHFAVLDGATVSKRHVRLSSDPVSPPKGGLDDEALAMLAERDHRLAGMEAHQLEGGREREARHRAAEEAALRAAELEQQAEASADEARHANDLAARASQRAAEADEARRTATAQAAEARSEAERLSS